MSEVSTIEVEEVETHEDGSATYQITASKEDMQKLFEAFFKRAIISGILETQESTEKWIAERDALELAAKLVKYLDVWENSDDLDYAPEVEDVKNALKVALKKVGGL